MKYYKQNRKVARIYTALNKEIGRDDGKNLYTLKQRDRPS